MGLVGCVESYDLWVMVSVYAAYNNNSGAELFFSGVQPNNGVFKPRTIMFEEKFSLKTEDADIQGVKIFDFKGSQLGGADGKLSLGDGIKMGIGSADYELSPDVGGEPGSFSLLAKGAPGEKTYDGLHFKMEDGKAVFLGKPGEDVAKGTKAARILNKASEAYGAALVEAASKLKKK